MQVFTKNVGGLKFHNSNKSCIIVLGDNLCWMKQPLKKHGLIAMNPQIGCSMNEDSAYQEKNSSVGLPSYPLLDYKIIYCSQICVNPVTPKIWLLILTSSFYTIPGK